jgi:magnesium transporter
VAIFRKLHPPVGARPGTLVVAADGVPPRTSAMRYSEARVEEMESLGAEEYRALVTPGTVTWVDVQGLGDEHVLRAFGDAFGLHPLALEDVVNAPQRPKGEEYPEHLLLVTRMVRVVDEELDIEQVAVVVGDHWVLSFQERYGDVLDPVRRRVREGLGPMRRSGAGYLAYALIDTIVDAYYPVMEVLTERIERLEDRIMARPSTRTLTRLNTVKTDLVLIRRGVWPQREALGRLLREPARFIGEDVRPYLRDTYDHCDQLSDVIDSHRELVNGLLVGFQDKAECPCSDRRPLRRRCIRPGQV